MTNAVTTWELLRQRLFRWLVAPELSAKKYTDRLALVSVPIFALCCLFLPRHFSAEEILSYCALVALAMVTSLFPVRISSSWVAPCPVLPMIMAILYLFGPALAVVTDVGTMLVQVYLAGRDRFRGQPDGMRWSMLVAATQQCVATGLAGLIYQSCLLLHLFAKHSFISAAILSLAAILSWYINAFIITTVGSKVYKVRWDIVWFENIKWGLPGAVLLSPLGFVMGALTEQSVALGALFIVLPIVAAQRGYVLHEKRMSVYRFGVDMLGRLMQEAHPYTHGHLYRVATWAKKIGEAVGLGPESMALIGDAAILHDIGKIAIDDRILNKPGKLSPEEWDTIKTHPVIGSDIVAEIRYLDRVSLWVRHHHERIDGAGYPDGLAGEAVPLESRIISVVDAFDAMVGGPSKEERRTYREPMSYEAACAELVRCSGTQFDEYVVMSFLRILDEEKMNVPTLPDDPELTMVEGDGEDHSPATESAGEPKPAVAKRAISHASSQAV